MVINISFKYQNLLRNFNDKMLAFRLCAKDILNNFHLVVGKNIKDLLPPWRWDRVAIR